MITLSITYFEFSITFQMKTRDKNHKPTAHWRNGCKKGQGVEPPDTSKKVEALKVENLSQMGMPKFFSLLERVQKKDTRPIQSLDEPIPLKLTHKNSSREE